MTSTIDDELLTQQFTQDPYPTYRKLRDDDPVHWASSWDQWLLTRYEDVIRVLREPETFANGGWEPRFIERLPADTQKQVPHLSDHFKPGAFLSIADPPDHGRMRRPVVKALAPGIIAKIQPRVERAVDRLLDDFEQRVQIDAVRDLGYPLPTMVITEAMGMPPGDRDQFLAWSRNIVDFLSTGSPEVGRALEANMSARALKAYLGAFIEARVADGDVDVVSVLAAAAELGEPFTEDELTATLADVLIGGHETTANLIANGLLALLSNPEQLTRLQAKPELAGAAVEEFLRFDTPVQRFRRVARHDLEIRGRVIHEGQLVMAFAGSANRDPAVFAEPDRVDIERSPNPHLAFGHGIHFCPGAALSRLEGRILFERIVHRFPGIRLAGGAKPRWRKNIAFRGLESLPIELA